MANLVELLLRLKPDWDRAYSEFASECEEDLRLSSQDVSRLLDTLLESHLTGESKMVYRLLDEWMQTPEDELADQLSFDQYQEISLITALHTLRAIVLHATQQQYTDQELYQIQAAIEKFFGRAVEYVAYEEAMENLRRVQRRQREVQEELEKLDESRANFVSIAAHGLKTPLTLVEGYSQMLKEQLAEESVEAQPLLAGIESGTYRMRELIDDLVDVAMIDNKMLSLYYQPMRIMEIIEAVAAQFDNLAKAKQLNFEIEEFPGSDLLIFADHERMEQALVEVVDNAVKFTPDKGAIQIGGRTLPGFIEISVKDSGVGIAPEDQVRIFEQFSKVSERVGIQEATGKSIGTGLGLHLCKGILEAHGGAIWVDSPGFDEENHPGSIFHLMIPAREEPPDDPSARLLGRVRG
jgi:signal transduction histidine kinase